LHHSPIRRVFYPTFFFLGKLVFGGSWSKE